MNSIKQELFNLRNKFHDTHVIYAYSLETDLFYQIEYSPEHYFYLVSRENYRMVETFTLLDMLNFSNDFSLNVVNDATVNEHISHFTARHWIRSIDDLLKNNYIW